MSDLVHELQASEELGEEAKKFLNTNLGRYLEGVSTQDIEAAKNELFDLNPYGFNDLPSLQSKISEIQRRGKTAELVRQYLGEVIINGTQATHTLGDE